MSRDDGVVLSGDGHREILAQKGLAHYFSVRNGFDVFWKQTRRPPTGAYTGFSLEWPKRIP